MNATAQSPFLLWEWTLYSEMKRDCTSQQRVEMNSKNVFHISKANRVSRVIMLWSPSSYCKMQAQLVQALLDFSFDDQKQLQQ
jgi:hypothetical protein